MSFIVHLVRYGRKEYYALKCGYNKDLIDNIKKLPKEVRDFNAIDKNWNLTATGLYSLMNMYKGKSDEVFFKFENDKQRTQFINIIKKHTNKAISDKEASDNLNNQNNEILSYKSNLAKLAEEFDYTPFLKEGVVPMKHQIEGALFAKRLLETDRNCLLAMDLGTGKTLTAIQAVEMMPEINKCLFIVPANLRLNIQKEIHTFTNSYCYVPVVNKRKDGTFYLTKYKRNDGRTLEECKYFVLSYDYFSVSKFDANKKILELGFNDIDMIIYDEFHYLTNKKNNRFENITKSFTGVVKKEMGLSATPLTGNMDKFFPLLKKLKPLEFSNEQLYREYFCGQKYFLKQGDYNKQYHNVNTPKIEELNKTLQTFMFRVKKEDVLKELPPLTIEHIVIEMSPSEQKGYDDIASGLYEIDWESNVLISDEDTVTSSALAILTRLRQYTSMVKLDKVVELINELNEYNEKVVFFDVFKDPLYALQTKLGNSSKIYSGDQSAETKQDLVDLFQDKSSDLKTLLVSLMAGNAGITLTSSSNVIQNTLSLIPHENSQAYGRIHRKGQTEKCNVIILSLADTVDEDIYDEYMAKLKIINAVIDGENIQDVTQNIEKEILEKLKSKYGKR